MRAGKLEPPAPSASAAPPWAPAPFLAAPSSSFGMICFLRERTPGSVAVPSAAS